MGRRYIIGGASSALLVLLGSAASTCVVWAQMDDNSPGSAFLLPALRPTREVALDMPARHNLLQNTLGVRAGRGVSRRLVVDLQPVLDEITGFLRAHGFPLHEDRELAGDKGIVFSADMRIDANLPAVHFSIGDRGPLDAFYANAGGFRVALQWPMPFAPGFALHLGGGEDSEFGNWAIVGVQWRHAILPLVVGLGMPVALGNANGDIGVICQMRMLLD